MSRPWMPVPYDQGPCDWIARLIIWFQARKAARQHKREDA